MIKNVVDALRQVNKKPSDAVSRAKAAAEKIKLIAETQKEVSGKS